MEIICNGKKYKFQQEIGLVDFLKELDFQDNSTAVWLNGRQVMFEDYKGLILSDGDELQLFSIVIGG